MGACLWREPVEDERFEHLKLRAMRYGLLAGFIGASLHARASKPGRGSTDQLQFLSALDLLVTAMSVALGLFRYWRWRDGPR